jgi:GNAT superfamily N-acetyltransferase
VTLSAPQPLGSAHRLDDFHCGQPTLDDWLVRHARQANASGSARTFVVTTGADAVVGYFALTVGQIDTLETPERIRQGMGRYPLPVVVLARLAVDQGSQGLGVGVGLLKDAIRRTLLIADQAGIRAMLTHPIDAPAAAFYRRFGFIDSPLGAPQMLLLLKDARRWVQPQP